MSRLGSRGWGKEKIAYLVKSGCEIANHSILHKNFSAYTAAQIQQEVGGADKLVTELNAEVKMETFALPMGKYPKNKALWPLLLKGSYQGHSYSYKAAFCGCLPPHALAQHRRNTIRSLSSV